MAEQMYAYKCTRCGRLHHPAYLVCRQCGNREFETVPLEGAATLLTYTRVYNLPEGYMKPWLAFGIVEFPNGLRVTGQIDSEDITMGMKLKATVGVVKEGVNQDYYGFIFKEAE
ncbi:OB-fold domain-containing protein [Moorella naiadis]|uniref:Zn-ribbon domain-containing OB-fold protein n=1 Tax=Moorella naiadis (nom. illeg.) TaxID=3093670 RepID=UPI003D9CA689